MTPLTGRATPEGTRRFTTRAVHDRGLPAGHFRAAPGELSLSSLGLGSYLGAPDGPTDLAVEHAVAVSLRSGRVNVLDTAINYRDQRAERSIGRALRTIVDAGTVPRDEIFLATKVGYLAPDGESPIPRSEWVRRELVEPGILDPRDVVEGSHAMSPGFLEDQFRRSRANLGVETVDLLYLHNAPEAQLATVGRERFLERLGAAFRICEEFRRKGQLAHYGLATWDSLRIPPGTEGHFELTDALNVAEEIGGQDHGFRFLQFPFNLSMPEAATWPTQVLGDRAIPLFDAAQSARLACLTSVPLLQGRLTRGKTGADGLSAAQTALQFARSAPGTLAALVGQKSAVHLSENLEVASRPPWDAEEFRRRLT